MGGRGGSDGGGGARWWVGGLMMGWCLVSTDDGESPRLITSSANHPRVGGFGPHRSGSGV